MKYFMILVTILFVSALFLGRWIDYTETTSRCVSPRSYMACSDNWYMNTINYKIGPVLMFGGLSTVLTAMTASIFALYKIWRKKKASGTTPAGDDLSAGLYLYNTGIYALIFFFQLINTFYFATKNIPDLNVFSFIFLFVFLILPAFFSLFSFSYAKAMKKGQYGTSGIGLGIIFLIAPFIVMFSLSMYLGLLGTGVSDYNFPGANCNPAPDSYCL